MNLVVFYIKEEIKTKNASAQQVQSDCRSVGVQNPWRHPDTL